MMRFPEKLDEGLFDELIFHFTPQVALFTAVRLAVFSAIENGNNRVPDIALATKCSPRGIRMLLDCLSAMGVLEKREESYRLNHCSKRYFLQSSDDYVGSLFFHVDQFMSLWLTLPEAVQTGGSTLRFSSDDEKERWNIDLVDSLFEVHKRIAWQLADQLRQSAGFLESEGAPGILDVAAGSAVWSIPFAQSWAGAEVVAIDFLPVLAIARKYTRRFGVESRYRFMRGDIREIEFGTHEFDLCILGHICHSEGERWSQTLIKKCFRALKGKGKLLIMDYLADEKKQPELLPSLLALNALLGTDEGDTFSFDQYRRWMLDTGFREAQVVEIHGHSPIIVGYKA